MHASVCSGKLSLATAHSVSRERCVPTSTLLVYLWMLALALLKSHIIRRKV